MTNAVKFLTQSTWSHAALFIGDRPGLRSDKDEALAVIEADVVASVRAVRLANFAGLQDDEVDDVIDYAAARLGHHDDLRNVVDLVRYLLPSPPVPLRWRRRRLAPGSGDPTRAICSTRVAQAFQAVNHPILPLVEQRATDDALCPGCVEEILHVRHHSLFVPRDFAVSPSFVVIKPSLEAGFDHCALRWAALSQAV